MNELAVNNSMSFDFEKRPIEVMDLDILKRTFKENNISGNPVKEMYHYQVIDKIVELCKNNNLDCTVEEIFAAQNKNKTLQGVAISPQTEKIYGTRAIEAHVLRRVFTTIEIKNWSNEELTTTLVLTYTQDGIKIAIGPNVRMCHNQCILNAKRVVANYGKEKVPTDKLFDEVNDWLASLQQDIFEDRKTIDFLKQTIIEPRDIYTFIGLLTANRVAHDSSDKRLSKQVVSYPLNQGQITLFTEKLLILKQEQDNITAWDMYNAATELYKPGKTDFPVIISQNRVFLETLGEFIGANL